MAGDPDPKHWYQQGFWYLKSNKIYLECTDSCNYQQIPSEINMKNVGLRNIEIVSTPETQQLILGHWTPKLIENLPPGQIDSYRTMRARSKSNPIDMTLPEAALVINLKQYSSFWGIWESKNVSIRLDPVGKFSASEKQSQISKYGWFHSGFWYLDGDYLILNVDTESTGRPIPAFFSSSNDRLLTSKDSLSGKILFSINGEIFLKREFK